jgi:hypothetical protein
VVKKKEKAAQTNSCHSALANPVRHERQRKKYTSVRATNTQYEYINVEMR